MNFRTNPYDVLGLYPNATLDQINEKTATLLRHYGASTDTGDQTQHVILQLIQQASNELKMPSICKKVGKRRTAKDAAEAAAADNEENKAFEKEWSALIRPTPIRRASCPAMWPQSAQLK